MSRKICLYTEELNPPFDEGYKNFTFNLFKEASAKYSALRIGSGDTDVIDVQINTNKLLLCGQLSDTIRKFDPDALIYVPTASSTPSSFLRARVLRSYARNKPVAMVGLQPRHYPGLAKPLLKAISPNLLYVQSESGKKSLTRDGFRAKVVSAGVDADRFCPVDQQKKTEIRQKFGINPDSYVVLHVGHINERRNVQALTDVMSIPNTQAVIVGSSSTVQDLELTDSLREKGVVVIDDYIERIEEVYQMADLYVFPVTMTTAAIEMPLSVMEAMACNLPVVTTKFGGLTDCFNQEFGLNYINNTTELLPAIEKARACIDIRTREQVQPFTWASVVGRLIEETLSSGNK